MREGGREDKGREVSWKRARLKSITRLFLSFLNSGYPVRKSGYLVNKCLMSYLVNQFRISGEKYRRSMAFLLLL